jgi:hypothetical protein
MSSEPIEFGSVSYVSRKLLYIHTFYLIWTFAIRQTHLPDAPEEIKTFLFHTFFNIGPFWLCYRMIRICTRISFERAFLALQLALMGWTIYAYRFAYVVGMPYDLEAYFAVPVQQYLITIPLFIIALLVGLRERHG